MKFEHSLDQGSRHREFFYPVLSIAAQILLLVVGTRLEFLTLDYML